MVKTPYQQGFPPSTAVEYTLHVIQLRSCTKSDKDLTSNKVFRLDKTTKIKKAGGLR